MSQKIYTNLDIKGNTTIGSIANATTDTDKFLVSDNGLVKYRTGAEMLSDLGIDAGAPTSSIQHQVKAAVAINKGQAVYVSGADGTNMLVSLASNATEATSSKTMGLLADTVAINGFSNVVAEGLLAGLNTSTAAAGDPVWLGTGGNLIYGLVNKPYAPAHLVFIGIVTRVNVNNGEIFVKVQNGFELDELHDVDLKSLTPVSGHILGFNGNLWVNKTIAGWLGYTPADSAHNHDDRYYTETESDSRFVNVTGDTMTGTLQINGSWATTILDGDNVVVRKPNYPSGGWARALLNFQEYTGTSLYQIGAYGSANTYTYGYLGTAYNDTIMRWYPNKEVIFDNVIKAPTFSDSNNTAYYLDPAAMSNIHNITANSFIKSGGTSAQILAADGSVITAGTNIIISGGVISSTDTNTVYTHPAYTARSIDTSGAQVIDVFTSDAIGSVTNITTRTMTLADLGYTGATNANFYTLPTATSTVLGGVKLFSDTVQSTIANAVSATAFRTYGVQVNAAGQMLVNVPWTDTVYTHPAYTARSIDTSGAQVIDVFTSDAIGSVTNITTRTMTLADIGAAAASHTHTFDSLTSKTGGTGTYQTSGDFRAPIFYDSNDTGYYINPASTSNILNLSAITTSVRRYYQIADGVPTSNLGSPSVTEMALFDNQFNNKTAFLDPAYLKFYTSTDGVSWTEYTGFSDGTKRDFVGGDNGSGVIIPNLTPYFAIEVSAVSYVFLNALYMYWSSNSHSTTVKTQIRRVDNATWYNHTTSSTAVGAWPGHLYMPFPTVPFLPGPSTSTGHYDKIRFIFQPTWSGGAYASSPIYLTKFECWGGYPAGKRNIYATDSLQNVTFPASLRATNFTDSENTAYYTDPSSTSNLLGLTVTNTITGNISGTAGSLLSYQSNWASTSTPTNVVGLLGWKNYGNGHVIFDASASTTPSGTSCSNTNPQNNWSATYPTLMGWNGANTYGVRVDSARVADSASSAGSVDFNNLTNKIGGTGNYITSGDFRAPFFYDSNDTSYYGDFASTSRQYQAISFGDSSRYSAINTTINGAGAGDKLILYGGASNYDARLLVGADYDMLFKSQGNTSGKGSFKFYSGVSSALAMLIDASQNTTVYGSATANSFVKSGGTSAQILAADGSVITAGTNITISGGVISSTGGAVYTHPAYTARSIDTSGAQVIDIFTSDAIGSVTNITTRTMTLADLGYTGATNANFYTLPTATSTVLGGIELFSDTVQTVAANAVSATASRTYGLQLNAAGQAVVNVPWVDTNTVYTHPAYTARSIDTSGAQVIDVFTSDAIGSVTNITTRTMTLADLGAASSTHTHDLVRYSLAAPAFIDSLTTTNFRTTLFGSTTNGYQISTSRWNNVPAPLTGLNQYGTMFAWAGSDTQGFIAMDYSAAALIVGGGNADNINWSRRVLVEQSWTNSKYFDTGGEIYGTRFYDANNSAYYLDPADATKSINVAGKVTVNVGSSAGTPVLEAVSTYGTMSINTYYGVLHTSGDFYIGNPASSGNNLYGNQARFVSFIDRNNSAYYLTPSSTSVLNRLSISFSDATYQSGITVTNTNTGAQAVAGVNMFSGAHSGSINMFSSGYMDLLNQNTTNGTIQFRPKATVSMYIDNVSSTSRVTIGGSNPASHPLRVTQQVSNVSIYADYDIVAYSDQSVKENIRPIENVLDRVNKSRGVLYDRIDSGEKNNIGFIAQELEVEFPELVVTNEDNTKAVKYQNAVAVLFEAVKEQQKQIEELKELVNKLITK